MFIQIDIPENLSNKLTILKGQLKLRNKQEVLLYVLDKFIFEEKENGENNKQKTN